MDVNGMMVGGLEKEMPDYEFKYSYSRLEENIPAKGWKFLPANGDWKDTLFERDFMQADVIYRRKRATAQDYPDVPVKFNNKASMPLLCPICQAAWDLSDVMEDVHCLGFVWEEGGTECIDNEYTSYEDEQGGLWGIWEEGRKKVYAKAVRFVEIE